MTAVNHDNVVGGMPLQDHQQRPDMRPGPEHGLLAKPGGQRDRLRQVGWTADEDRNAVAQPVARIVLEDPAYGLAGSRQRPFSVWAVRPAGTAAAELSNSLDATDVSCMAGHANVRTTLLMYVGTTAGILDRARKATD